MLVTLDEAKLGKIEKRALTQPLSEIAAYLQETIGQKITAYVSGLNDIKEVGQWAKGVVKPRSPADMKLRYAYRIVQMITEVYGNETAKAWLFGTNTRLQDQAPAYLLRHADNIKDFQELKLIPVARAFAGSVE